MNRRLGLLALALALSLGAPARATELVDEARLVSTEVRIVDGAVIDDDSDTRAPDDFDFFERAIEAYVGVGTLESRATATQISEMSSTTVDAQGSATTGLDGSFGVGQEGSAVSASITDLTFRVDVASDYHLSGTLTGIAGGEAQVQIDGPSGTVYAQDAVGTSFEFDSMGTLEPGQYRFHVRATAENEIVGSALGLEDAIAAYSAVLTVTDATPLEPVAWSALKARFR